MTVCAAVDLDSAALAGRSLAARHGVPTGVDDGRLVAALLGRIAMLQRRVGVQATARTGAAADDAADPLVAARSYVSSRYCFRLPVLGLATGAALRVEAVADAVASLAAPLRQLPSFLAAYQQSQSLSLNELWALRHLLGLALIERASGAAAGPPPNAAPQTDAQAVALAQAQWDRFVEQAFDPGPCDPIFRRERSGGYAASWIGTREACCARAAALARRWRCDLQALATAALQLADAAHAADPQAARAHVGFYLGDGTCELHASMALATRCTDDVPRARARRHRAFLWAAAVLSAVAVTLLWLPARHASAWIGVALVAALAVVCLDTARQFLEKLLLHLVPRRAMPRLDFRAGIPDQARTVLAIPCMLSAPAKIDQLCARLEQHFLANQDRNLLFALATDLPDADAQTMPADAALVAHAAAAVAALNRKHAGDRAPPFYLFHRARAWNAQEQCWMGWERKRGKLLHLARFLRDRDSAPFAVIEGDATALGAVPYLICVDSDNEVPPAAAIRLVETQHHPLNRPVLDPQTGVVVAGHGALSPSSTFNDVDSTRSVYSRIVWSKVSGLPYPGFPDREVYNDAFEESFYLGKGIVVVDAFLAAVGERFPDNRILSHDVIEGCYARVGFADAVNFREPCPYDVYLDVVRIHRWTRGDWQNAAWVLPWVPVPRGDGRSGRAGTPLSLLSRWKLLCNLVRALNAMAQLTLMIAGWALLPWPWLWTAVVAASMVGVEFGFGLYGIVRRACMSPRLWPLHLRALAGLSLGGVQVLLFKWVIMPTEAATTFDAMVRSIWRMSVSGRRLLQWRPSEEVTSIHGPLQYLRFMWLGPALALATTALLAVYRPVALPAAIVPMLVWLVSPLLAAYAGSAQGTRAR